MRSEYVNVLACLYEKPDEHPLTVVTLKNEIEKNEIICAGAVLAQMKLESSHFKSFLCLNTNNLMGMRYPFSRPTVAAGIYIPGKDTIILGCQEKLNKYRNLSNTYAYYNSWRDAVKDYKLWQERYFNLDERYLAFLSRVYAEDVLYIRKIKQISDK